MSAQVQTQLLATGSVFLLPSLPEPGSLALYLNGLFLDINVDYLLTGARIALLHKSLSEADVLLAWYATA